MSTTRLLPSEVWTERGPALDPSTSPEAIAATHRAIVAAAVDRVLADWHA